MDNLFINIIAHNTKTGKTNTTRRPLTKNDFSGLMPTIRGEYFEYVNELNRKAQSQFKTGGILYSYHLEEYSFTPEPKTTHLEDIKSKANA